jgi:hypothetical protein
LFAQGATGKPIEDITNMVKGLGGLLSNLVSPKGQKFRALLTDRKYFDAAEMYAADKPYFDGQNPSFAVELKALGEGLNAEYEPEIVKDTTELEARRQHLRIERSRRGVRQRLSPPRHVS